MEGTGECFHHFLKNYTLENDHWAWKVINRFDVIIAVIVFLCVEYNSLLSSIYPKLSIFILNIPNPTYSIISFWGPFVNMD